MAHLGKKAAAAILTAALLCPLSAGAGGGATAYAAERQVQILLDDVPLDFDSPPVLQNGVTFVPFRAIGEALGIKLVWNSGTQTVTATGSNAGTAVAVALQIGNKTATVNDTQVELPAAPQMLNNRVMIPLSFFSTQFGAQVGWTQETATVSIVSPQKEMHLRAFYAIKSFQERDLISGMNSVAYGWSRIDSSGRFTLEGDDYRMPEAAGDVTAESLVADAASEGVTPYLMVYASDANQELTTMLSTESLRSQAIDDIKQTVQEKGFSGVVLDFEGLGLKLNKQEQSELLNRFAKELRAALPDSAALSLAVPPPNSAYQGYDHKTLSGIADDLIIMAYQYNPSGTAAQVPEPNDKVQEGIELTLAAGVPKDKLLLGIDLSSETPSSIGDKLGLAKRYDLKGAAFWRLGLFRNYTDGMEEAVAESVTKE